MVPELNQYGSTETGWGNFIGGTKDFLDFGMDSWGKIEQINAIRDSNSSNQNQLAEVDQQVQPVVHQAPAAAPAPTMIGGFSQKTIIGGLVAVVILGLIVRGNS